MELIFEVRDAEEGGYWARALGEGIFTQAESWEELRKNVLEAAQLHFADSELPERIRLIYSISTLERSWPQGYFDSFRINDPTFVEPEDVPI